MTPPRLYTDVEIGRLPSGTRDLALRDWCRAEAQRLVATPGALPRPIPTVRTTIDELMRSAKATQHGVPNRPETLEEWENGLLLCMVCDDVRSVYESLGYTVRWNSGFRSDVVNRLTGGSKTSDHRRFLAADAGLSRGGSVIVDYEKPARELYDRRGSIRIRPQQIIAEPGHVHFGMPDRHERSAGVYKTELRHKTLDGHFPLIEASV